MEPLRGVVFRQDASNEEELGRSLNVTTVALKDGPKAREARVGEDSTQAVHDEVGEEAGKDKRRMRSETLDGWRVIQDQSRSSIH